MIANYAGVDLNVSTEELRNVVARQVRPEHVFHDLSERGRKTSAWTFINHTLHSRPITLDSIWWPTGASRWATAFFVVDGASLADIEKVTQAGGSLTKAKLKWQCDPDAGDPQLSADMYQLPAIPIWQFGQVPSDAKWYSEENLYLLGLVDQRYYWWFSNSDNIKVADGCDKTWAQLYDAVGSALGLTIAYESINSAYLKPCHLLTSHWEFIPQLLDTIAYNVGQRIISDTDGNVSAQSSLEALSKQTTLLAENDQRGIVIGNDMFPDTKQGATVLPKRVGVIFPKQLNADKSYKCKYDIKTNSLISLAISQAKDVVGFEGQKNFQDTALWHEGVNDTEIGNLADIISRDFYRWQMGRIHGTYHGIQQIPLNGLIDSVEWIDTGEQPVGEFREFDSANPLWDNGIFTIVRRAPFNDLTHELLHCGTAGCDPECVKWEPICIVMKPPSFMRACPEPPSQKVWCAVAKGPTKMLTCTEGMPGGSGGTFNLQVEDYIGGSTYSNINKLQIVHYQGLGVSNPSAGIARIYGGADIGAVAYRTSSQSVGSGSTDPITFSGVMEDTASFWSGGDPTKLSFAAAGNGVFLIWYSTFEELTFSSDNVDQTSIMEVYLNGSPIPQSQHGQPFNKKTYLTDLTTTVVYEFKRGIIAKCFTYLITDFLTDEIELVSTPGAPSGGVHTFSYLGVQKLNAAGNIQGLV